MLFSGGEDREHLGHVPICWLSTSQALKLRNLQAEGALVVCFCGWNLA